MEVRLKRREFVRSYDLFFKSGYYKYRLTYFSAIASNPEASLAVSFKCNSNQGAILTIADPVTRNQLGNTLSALQQMADNTSKIMHQHKDIVKRHGIWIITKAYSTRSCAITIITSKSSSISITLNNICGILALMPNSAWSGSSGSSCTKIHKDVDGVVVLLVEFISLRSPGDRGWVTLKTSVSRKISFLEEAKIRLTIARIMS